MQCIGPGCTCNLNFDFMCRLRSRRDEAYTTVATLSSSFQTVLLTFHCFYNGSKPSNADQPCDSSLSNPRQRQGVLAETGIRILVEIRDNHLIVDHGCSTGSSIFLDKEIRIRGELLFSRLCGRTLHGRFRGTNHPQHSKRLRITLAAPG